MAGSGDVFLTLTEAKAILRVTFADEDDLIALYAQMAQSIVIEYLERATTDSLVLGTIAEWDGDTVPELVRAAVMAQLGELYEVRTVAPTLPVPADLSPEVRRYLGRWIEAVIA
jgi:Phage gp6-like head-tail connector protein